MSKQGNKTLVYSPEVRVYVKGEKTTMDLSSDVVSGSVTRITNGVSSAQITLNNHKSKYTGKLRRMDPIVIFLKKTHWVQVFSGYLDVVPALDLYPTTCTIRASCTLKRLKYTYWDPGLPAALDLMTQKPDQKAPDMGVGKMLIRLLEVAGGWDKSKIQVQQIPKTFLEYSKKYMAKDTSTEFEAYVRSLLNVGGAVGGETGSGAPGEMVVSQSDPADAPGLNAFMYAIRQHESNGNYKAANPGSSARGAYQYIRGTWANYGGYSEAHLAPPAVQDKRAWNDFYTAYKKYGSWDKVTLVHFTGNPNYPLDKVPGPGNPTPRKYLAHIHELMAQFKPTNVAPQTQTQSTTPAADATKALTQTAPTTGTPTSPVSPTVPAPNATPATKEKLDKPVGGAQVAKFGKITDPKTKKPVDAQWVDIAAPAGTDVKASVSGIITAAGSSTDPNWGMTSVEIASSPTLSVKYGGLKEVKVASGSQVKKGDVIGKSGGLGFTDKVRWAVTKDGKAVDPMTEVGKEQTVDIAAVQAQQQQSTSTGPADQTGQMIQDAVFNVLFHAPRADNRLSTQFTGEKALMNDEQLLSSVSGIAKASLREFMSAPNGDFIAFFPDYFGVNDTTPKIKIEDVEMKDVKIMANDDAIATHVYATGDIDHSGGVNELDMMASAGVVTVNQPFVFKQLIQVVEAERKNFTPENFFKRYGARPFKFEFAAIGSREYEFFQALQLFQRKWAEQSTTNVSLTFMPELYPGMRVELSGHDIGVYVNTVTHNFSFTDGFKTQAEFSCPTSISKGVGSVLPAGV